MRTSRELLENQLERYENELNETKAYVKELKSTAAAPGGVDEEHFAQHLSEAEHNINYYEGGIKRVKDELRNYSSSGEPRRGLAAILPELPTEGTGAVILLGIGVAVGILIGSAMSGRGGR